MTEQDFQDYCTRVGGFTSKVQTIQIASTVEAFPSPRPCDVCGASRGFRKEFTGYVRDFSLPLLFEACLDCSHCLEIGQPPSRERFIHLIR